MHVDTTSQIYHSQMYVAINNRLKRDIHQTHEYLTHAHGNMYKTFPFLVQA